MTIFYGHVSMCPQFSATGFLSALHAALFAEDEYFIPSRMAPAPYFLFFSHRSGAMRIRFCIFYSRALGTRVISVAFKWALVNTSVGTTELSHLHLLE